MLPELLQTTNLFHLLHRIDINLAEQQKNAGCPFCGGPLHHSSYQRKPRGGPELPEDLYKRLSLCCGNEKCRRRTLPPSTLFIGNQGHSPIFLLKIKKPIAQSVKPLTPDGPLDRKPSLTCWNLGWIRYSNQRNLGILKRNPVSVPSFP
jgi:hypothetical protein